MRCLVTLTLMILAFCDFVDSECSTELTILLFAAPDELPQSSSIRVPKIRTIFGVIGLLKLLAGDKFSITYVLNVEI